MSSLARHRPSGYFLGVRPGSFAQDSPGDRLGVEQPMRAERGLEGLRRRTEIPFLTFLMPSGQSFFGERSSLPPHAGAGCVRTPGASAVVAAAGPP